MSSNSAYPSDSTGAPAPTQSGSTELQWLSFSGLPNESVSTFVQSVQRVALQQNRMIDDVWVAHYAAACFSGDSLLWYSDLDEAIRNSWSELRRALLRQYLQNRQHNPPSAVPPAPGNSYLPQPPAAGPARRARPLSQSPSDIRRGRIEVFLPQHARTVGFLAFNERASTFSTVQDLAQAQVISFPNVPLNSRFHIRMEGPQVPTQYPYLGLALKNVYEIAPHIIPPPLRATAMQAEDITRPSEYCRSKSLPGPAGRAPIATWIFRHCAQSSEAPRLRRSAKTAYSQERASSAIWIYDESTEKLSMMWRMDDDTEGELKAIVPNDGQRYGSQGTLHMHRSRDWTPAQSRLDEWPAELHFIPEEL